MLRISFALTKEAFLAGLKTETRRIGWRRLRAPAQLLAVSQGMGLKPGQRADVYGPITVIETEREPLSAITPEGVRREGFPNWTTVQFIEFFCQHHACEPDKLVTRIRFNPFSQWCTCGHALPMHRVSAFGSCYELNCSCVSFCPQSVERSVEYCKTCGHALDLVDEPFRVCSACWSAAVHEACSTCGHARAVHEWVHQGASGVILSITEERCGQCACAAFVASGRRAE